jgi:hypothetical protein
MHEQSYDRAVKAFIKVRKQDAAEPVPVPVPVAAVRRELDDPVPILGLDGRAGPLAADSPCPDS